MNGCHPPGRRRILETKVSEKRSIKELIERMINSSDWNRALIISASNEINHYFADEWRQFSKRKMEKSLSPLGKSLWSSSVLNGTKGIISGLLTSSVKKGEDFAENIFKEFLSGIDLEEFCRGTPPNLVAPLNIPPIVEDIPNLEDVPEVTTIINVKEDITDRIKLSGKHKQAARIKRYLRLRLYVFLHGSPGGGKSTLAAHLAEDMGLKFQCMTLNPDSTKSELIGNRSILNGETFHTKFGNFYENGGFVCIDEVGMGTGGILNILNSALSPDHNGDKFIEFPDGRRVKMHKEFFLMFCDNSNLWGNDPLFSERQDLGAAFRDRLSYIRFEYDNAMELRILTKIWGSKGRAEKWNSTVVKMREIIEKAGIPLFASPRFSFAASKLIIAGDSFLEALESSLWQGLPEDSISGIKNDVLRLWKNESENEKSYR